MVMFLITASPTFIDRAILSPFRYCKVAQPAGTKTMRRVISISEPGHKIAANDGGSHHFLNEKISPKNRF